jgi:hypothetical protein
LFEMMEPPWSHLTEKTFNSCQQLPLKASKEIARIINYRSHVSC